jgi:uncharacterized membrane protein
MPQEKTMPPESPHWMPTPLLVLVLAWSVINLSIVATLIYLITREFTKKANAGDLPQILAALAPLVLAIAHLLTRISGAALLNAITPARQQPAAAQTDGEITHEPGEWQA